MSMKKREDRFDEIIGALVHFEGEAAKRAAIELVQMGVTAEKVVDTMSEGMDIIGKKFQAGEYYVTELIIAGEIMMEVLEILKPYLEREASGKLGTAVVATVKGDLHDLGKNIFVMLMKTAGFKIIDLGVDVSVERIVDAIKDFNADILGLSALLTTNLEQFPIVVNELISEGLRENVKIIVGGATVTEVYAKEAGVDAYVRTALDGVEICKGWAISRA